MLKILEEKIKALEAVLTPLNMRGHAELGLLRIEYAEALDAQQNKEIDEL